MVSLRQCIVLLALVTTGCSFINASTSHTRGSDAGPVDAPAPAAPTLRVAHLARDTGPVDVYADGRLLTGGLGFSSVGEAAEIPGADIVFRVTRAGSEETLVEQTFSATAGRSYTLTLYGDEDSPPFPERTLALLLLDEDASGLDVTRDVRLAVVHVASPVIAGQLVAVTPSGNVLLADDFGFAAIAPLSLPSMAYTVGFDAGADGVIDVEFEVPALVPGTYANVFVAARPDDSVYLLVSTADGATLEIDASGTPPRSPASVRVAHLARDTGSIDVYANDRLLTGGLELSEVGAPADVSDGRVTFRVTRAGSVETLLEETLTTEPGRKYTLTLYGDEDRPPFPERTLALLLLDDDASGLDVAREIRLAVVHVASPVIAGQLVAITPTGNTLLASDFGFTAVAPLTLPSMAYTVGFDAGADGVIDVEFDVPALVPGTYANVFVAARPDDSVYLLVNTAAGATVEIDAADRSPPTVRVAHLARDTGPVDVYADGNLLARALDFADVSMSLPVSAGSVAFRVTRAGTEESVLTQTLTTELGRGYTLAVYGDEDSPPFPERTLALLLLDDDASGLDVTRDIRLAVIHVASPVIAGQLVAVTPTGNVLLADDFGFRAVAPLTLPSMAYTVGFDAGADGVIDVEFEVPALVPGTYANVFVAARPDGSVFLLVNTGRGATVEIDPS